MEGTEEPQVTSPDGVKQGVTRVQRRKTCRLCGQHHGSHEPHVYDYVEDIDEDVSCHICLQPLVTPVDTPCGHTFCHPCLMAFLKVQQMCPVDRKPLSKQLCSQSSLVLKKLLEKLKVRCPSGDLCDMTLPRGELEDHLKYRCPGNWCVCPYSTAGCEVRGPLRTIELHSASCSFKDHCVVQEPIQEGRISYLEIPRTNTSLGITIVGGADTPLRCVVIQEVFPDGLIAQDGRLQAGDQIIEVNGMDTSTATHHQVCMRLRQAKPVFKLGIYRERIEEYKSAINSPRNASPLQVETKEKSWDIKENSGELITVTLFRETGVQLGIKLGGRRTEPGIFIMELMEDSVACQDGRLSPNDRILAINGNDVRYARLDQAFRLIKQSREYVALVVSRYYQSEDYEHLFRKPHPDLSVNHLRTKSAPDRLVEHVDNYTMETNKNSVGDSDIIDGCHNSICQDRSASCESLSNHPNYNGPKSNGSLYSHGNYGNGGSLGSLSEMCPLYQSNGSVVSIGSPANRSSGSLSVPYRQYIQNEEDPGNSPPALPPRSRQPLCPTASDEQLNGTDPHAEEKPGLETELSKPEVSKHDTSMKSSGSGFSPAGFTDIPDGGNNNRSRRRRSRDCSDIADLQLGIRKALRIEGSQFHQKTVTISKAANESLGMRIGGGVASNEGDTPIYIANIHPQGPVGKPKNVKKGDILLSVNGQSLLGLTHSQAVSLLKATAELKGVTLSLLDGPETSSGPGNFVPSWLYWQKLPRSLQISKSVVLHRASGASLGFSIVGGADPQRGPEPIHVLYVVATSPAALDGKLRCGDRLLSVDGHSLEGVTHENAVYHLKQAGQRVHLEVISWLGTEL